MATITKTFAFLSDAEGWTYHHSTGNTTTGARDGAVGNPAGSLYAQIVGRRVTGMGYWEWTGTFEDLGVPSGATVSAIRVQGIDWRCTVYTTGASSHAGPVIVGPAWGDGGTTLWAGADFAALGGSWSNPGAQGDVSIGPFLSTHDATLWVESTLNTGNSASATVRVNYDNISVTVTYAFVWTGAQTFGATLSFSGDGTFEIHSLTTVSTFSFSGDAVWTPPTGWSGDLTLSATLSMLASAIQAEVAAGTFSATHTFSGNALAHHVGALTFPATFTFSADALLALIASGDFSAAISMIADGTFEASGSWEGALTIAHSFAMTANAIGHEIGSANFIATLAMIANAVQHEIAGSTFSATITAIANAIQHDVAAGSFAATLSVLADAGYDGPDLSGDATFSALLSMAGDADFEAAASWVGALVLAYALSIQSNATQQEVGGESVAATVAFSGDAVYTPPGAWDADAAIPATFTIAADAVQRDVAAATFVATMTSTLDAIFNAVASLAISSTFAFESDAIADHIGDATFSASFATNFYSFAPATIEADLLTATADESRIAAVVDESRRSAAVDDLRFHADLDEP